MRINPITPRTAALAALLPLSAGAALAQSAELTPEHLAALDKDKNGVVTRAEFDAFSAYAFQQMDADRNGVVTAAEIDGHILPEKMGEIDSNGDKAISQAEFAAKMNADFSIADSDGNGVLD